ncbi:MAG: zinc-binding dehydrogenase, partial [Thermoproteus sp.]|nr:zinc-binding dehydrogenase [Thermoproteus sp.]
PVKAVRELTDGRGADFVIEAVGADETVDAAVEMAAPGGKVVLVGLAPVGHKTPVHLARVVRGGATLIGNYGARPRLDFKPLYEMVKRGLINPAKIVNRFYALDEVNRAVEDLRRGYAARPVILLK